MCVCARVVKTPNRRAQHQHDRSRECWTLYRFFFVSLLIYIFFLQFVLGSGAASPVTWHMHRTMRFGALQANRWCFVVVVMVVVCKRAEWPREHSLMHSIFRAYYTSIHIHNAAKICIPVLCGTVVIVHYIRFNNFSRSIFFLQKEFLHNWWWDVHCTHIKLKDGRYKYITGCCLAFFC